MGHSEEEARLNNAPKKKWKYFYINENEKVENSTSSKHCSTQIINNVQNVNGNECIPEQRSLTVQRDEDQVNSYAGEWPKNLRVQAPLMELPKSGIYLSTSSALVEPNIPPHGPILQNQYYHNSFTNAPTTSDCELQTVKDQLGELQTITGQLGELHTIKGQLGELQTVKNQLGDIQTIKGQLSDQEYLRNSISSPLSSRPQISPNNIIRSNGLIPTLNVVKVESKEEYIRKRTSSMSSLSKEKNAPSREVHNKLEKNRRAHLKECFEALRNELPSMEDKKISNQTILKAAQRHIQALKRKEKELEHDMERLAREKIAMQQKVAALKKELQTKYDHIDFSVLLPEVPLEQRDKDTKSTTTASEQPDLDDECDFSTFQNLQLKGEHSPSRFRYVEKDIDLDQPLNLSTGSVSKYEPVHEEWESKSKPIEWESRRKSVDSGCGSQISCLPVNETQHPIKNGSGSYYKKEKFSRRDESITLTKFSASNSTQAINHDNQLTQVNLPPSVSPQFSHIVKGSTSISHVPSIAKVVAIPANQTDGVSKTDLYKAPNCVNQIPHLVSVSSNLGKIPSLMSVGTTITRVATANSLTTSVNSDHSLPIVAGGGLQIPAHIVANSVHLGTSTSGIINQQAIQVITPEGYKLLSTDGSVNGPKPVAITLTQPEGMEGISEDGKQGPFMVSVNKNGLSTLHLTVPTATRSISASTQGSSSTTVPLNLTVGGAATLKVSQSSSASLLPSAYIPVANSNGITRLVPGMSVVAPLVVSPSQRGVMVPASTLNKKSSNGLGSGVPIVPHYASTLTGGLVNSVVVVSAPASDCSVADTRDKQ